MRSAIGDRRVGRWERADAARDAEGREARWERLPLDGIEAREGADHRRRGPEEVCRPTVRPELALATEPGDDHGREQPGRVLEHKAKRLRSRSIPDRLVTETTQRTPATHPERTISTGVIESKAPSRSDVSHHENTQKIDAG
jgi:hypothetical protein